MFHNDGWGELLLDIGNLDQAFDIYIHNQSILFQVLKENETFISQIENLKTGSLKESLAQATKLKQAFETLKKNHPTVEAFRKECEWVLDMLIHACGRGLAVLQKESLNKHQEEAIKLRAIHHELWHLRNRPGEYELTRKFFESMIKS